MTCCLWFWIGFCSALSRVGSQKSEVREKRRQWRMAAQGLLPLPPGSADSVAHLESCNTPETCTGPKLRGSWRCLATAVQKLFSQGPQCFFLAGRDGRLRRGGGLHPVDPKVAWRNRCNFTCPATNAKISWLSESVPAPDGAWQGVGCYVGRRYGKSGSFKFHSLRSFKSMQLSNFERHHKSWPQPEPFVAPLSFEQQ